MKRLLILIVFLSPVLMACSQTKGSAKLYGFKETVLSGMNPTILNEDEQTSESDRKPGMNYFIYLQSVSRVYPSEIWIEGKVYSVSFESIKSPVERQEFTAPGSGKTVLVPATDERLIQLTPVPGDNLKISEKGPSLSKDNQLVVVYKQGGKFYYSTLKTLKELTPVALQ